MSMTKVSGIERSRIFLWTILYGGACPIPPYPRRLLSEMINEIYNKRILELAADIRGRAGLRIRTQARRFIRSYVAQLSPLISALKKGQLSILRMR